MILPQIPPGIRSLHNHLLPRHRTARERQLVARTAPLRLRPARDPHGGEAVGQIVRDGPGRLGTAHVGSAAGVAPAARGAAVRQGVVVAVAGRHGAGGEGGGGDLARPGAGGFAAVPVAGR
ncbi:hypothetical protein Landi51_00275 [Colletotrichum acutatum]